jgi:hypothetical protein
MLAKTQIIRTKISFLFFGFHTLLAVKCHFISNQSFSLDFLNLSARYKYINRWAVVTYKQSATMFASPHLLYTPLLLGLWTHLLFLGLWTHPARAFAPFQEGPHLTAHRCLMGYSVTR